MPTKRKVASIAFTGATVATVAGFNAQPVAAQQSQWTIDPGGPFVAHNDTDAILAVSASGGPVSLNCLASTVDATGTLKTSATGAPTPSNPVNLGTITTATFGAESTPCSLFGLGWVLRMTQPASLQASSYTPGDNPPTTGVTKGKINNLRISINGVAGYYCEMVWSGSLPVSFHNDNGVFAVNPTDFPYRPMTMHVETARGCLGLYQPGDPATIVINTLSLNPTQTIVHDGA
jgi:hypothetical protein